MNRETKSRARAPARPVDCAGSRRRAFRSVSVSAVLLLLLCAPMLCAQATLGTTTGITNALAINSNNSPGLAYNAVLNTDSSVSLLQDGAILGTVVCAPYTVMGASITVSSGAIFVDSANSRIYLAMIAGGAVYAAYESFNQTAGTCTPGPLLQLTTNAQSNLEINVDPVQGNVYILNSFGAFPDTLYILPIASWSASSAAKLNMDYSAQYGPIVIDPSNDVVYVNDLGGSTAGTVGTYSTSGFFVYDPNFSATPANNLQHVVGYNASGGMPPTPFYVGTLLSNGAGKLVLVNENPSASSTNLSVPITILNTTAPQSLFFTNTTNPYSYNNDVDITPGAALSTISAASSDTYTAISGADINATSNVAYVFAFNSNSPTTPGLLLEYNLAPGATTPETVLSSSAAMPNLYSSLAPWSEMNYNSESTELVLSVSSEYVSGALGLTSQLCAGPPFSLTQLFGSSLAPTPLGYPVVNSVSGYTYAIQPASSYPAVPPVLNFVAPPSGCTASTPIQISPSALYAGFPNESYFQNFTATGGSGTGYTWSITFGGTALTNLGLTFTSGGDLSGYPNASGSYSFTVQVTDSLGNTATKNYTLTIYPDFTVLPSSLPAGTVGTAYSQQFTASGGAGGPYSFSVISGTALSAVGLTLSPGGLISGTPSTTETAAALLIKVADSQGYYTEFNYPLTVNAATSTPAQVTDNETITVTDAETFPDVVDSEPITVTDAEVVRAYNPFAITPTPASFNAASGNGYATYAYSVPFTATGGIGTLTLTETGALPTGVTFINGVLGGTPVASSVGNTYTFSVTATDADGDSITVPGYSLTILAASAYPAMVTDNETITVTDTETFPDVSDSETITVTDKVLVTANSPLAIAGPASLPAGELNVAYPATTFSASGGSGAYTWSATGLPAGLTMSPGGVLSGTPNSAGVFATTVTVLDSSANTNSVIFSLSVASPSLGISASPTTLTIAQGKSGQITITFTPVGGYSGTVTLSCSGLPANTLCVFTLNGAAIKSYTFPGNNQPVSVVLTIETDVSALARTEPAPTPQRPGAIMTAIAFWCPGSLLGVIVLRRKRKLFTKNPSTFGLCLFVLLVGAIAGLAGCISGGGFGTYVTPTGTSTVTVVVTPGSGSAQTLNIGVTVTQ